MAQNSTEAAQFTERSWVTHSLLPTVIALFWALFSFASTFFYILSQKALLAFFLFSTDYLCNFALNSTI